jgi:hypothetical protein
MAHKTTEKECKEGGHFSRKARLRVPATDCSNDSYSNEISELRQGTRDLNGHSNKTSPRGISLSIHAKTSF